MTTQATGRIILLIFGLLLILLSTEGAGVSEYFPDERDALMQFRDIANSTFNLHANWTGPPCYKNHSRWAGITCLNWHVTHLVLEGIQLRGSLPPLFLRNITFLSKLSFRNNSLDGPLPDLTNLKHLEFVFLSQNQFSGSIPLGYIDLTKLTKLELQENDLTGEIPPFNQQSLVAFNVSYNQLQGQIPQTPVLARFSMSSFDHNSNLCGRPLGRPCPILAPPPGNAPMPSPSGDDSSSGLRPWTLGLIVAAAALVPVCVILIFLCYYRIIIVGKETTQEQSGEGSKDLIGRPWHWPRSQRADDPETSVGLEFFNEDKHTVFNLDELLRASAEVIGKGKVGTTYKSMLESGSVVAVKRLKETNKLRKRDFTQQMHLLGQLKHDNIVEIITFYYSKDEKLIVSEYVPNSSSLFALLHENRGYETTTVLDWNARLSIIKDIAKGVDFLHQCLPSDQVLPHGNLKLTNILIQRENHSYRVKITDYGFLPIVLSLEQLAAGKTPEFTQGKKLSRKADVYCFGIVALEVITGKVSIQVDAAADDLCDWVRSSGWSTDIVDVQIVAEREAYDGMLKLTQIALECTDMEPQNRPHMSQVLEIIQSIEFQTRD